MTKLMPPKIHADPGFFENKAIWDAQNKFRTQALPIATSAAKLCEIHDELMEEAERTGEAPTDSFERWCNAIDELKAELSKAGYSEQGKLQ